MQEQKNDNKEVFSKRVRAGKRTYFFDVKTTRGNDYYITITESKRRFEDGVYVKHKIFLYKEDFNKFMDAFTETVHHVKTDLMPEYDFDEFQRTQDEKRAEYESENNESDSDQD